LIFQVLSVVIIAFAIVIGQGDNIFRTWFFGDLFFGAF